MLEKAAADASPFFEDMLMAVGAFRPEIIVSHAEAIAEIVRAAPAVIFAGGSASVFDPVAVRAAANGIKLAQIELFGFIGLARLDLLIDAFRIKIRAPFDEVFHLL